MGVLTGDAEHFVSAHALVLGDELAHMADHAGIAAAAAHRLGGHVGAIGFQHNAFQAQGLNGFYRALGAFKGTAAAKADQHSLPGNPQRIVGAAAVAVQHTLGLVFFQKFVGVSFGTLIMALFNGTIIGFFSRFLDNHFEFVPIFKNFSEKF